jgi:hypothetical protein
MRSWKTLAVALAGAGVVTHAAAQQPRPPAPAPAAVPTATPVTGATPVAPAPPSTAQPPPPAPPREAEPVVEPVVTEPVPEPAPPPAPVEPLGAAPGEGEGYTGPDRVMLAVIAGGVGVVGIGMFGIFGALSNSMISRLESACPNENSCDPKHEKTADRGRTYQTVANAGLGIGIVGLAAAGGMVLWMFLQPDAEEAQSARVLVGPGSFLVQGSF